MPATPHLRLGVNIDHVATIRNARGGRHPDPVRAAKLAIEAGADGITAHLREDRRHIADDDIARLSNEIDLPLNLELAATKEMLAIALKHRPHADCLVPEKPDERTTEGWLDVVRGHNSLVPYFRELGGAGIRVALFVEPSVPSLSGLVRQVRYAQAYAKNALPVLVTCQPTASELLAQQGIPTYLWSPDVAPVLPSAAPTVASRRARRVTSVRRAPAAEPSQARLPSPRPSLPPAPLA